VLRRFFTECAETFKNTQSESSIMHNTGFSNFDG